jgi:hypothetical protein
LISIFSEVASITNCTSRNFHRRGGTTNPGATLFRLFLSHQTALSLRRRRFFSTVRQPAIDLFARDVAQNHVTPRELSHCAMPEPITPAPITARARFFRRRSRRSLLVFLREEKIANQVLRRLRLAKLDNPSSSNRNDSSGEIDKVLLMIS